MCNLLVKKGAPLMNNLKILMNLPKRSRYIIVLLFFLSFISFLSFSQRVFAVDAPEQAAKEAPAPGVELPQFEAGQAPASSQAPEGQPAGESGTATAAVEEEEAGPVQYRAFFGIDSRLIVWIVSELHLMFAAFVLGVPIFAVIVEIVGFKGGDIKYDKMAKEFTKLLSAAFATTASLGGLLGFNLFGTGLKFITNSWAKFMMRPAGVAPTAGKVLSLSHAIYNPLWMPVNIHRLIANVCFGGFVVGAYAAGKFLGSKSEEEKAHY